VPRWDNAHHAHSRVSKYQLWFWKPIVVGGLYKYPIKNLLRTAKFLPTFWQVKGIARVFNWLKCLGGIMHLKPTAECQISTLIFKKKRWRGVFINIPWKIYQGRQSSCPLLAKLKVLPGSLTDFKCLGGIMHLKPTAGFQNINFDIWKQIVEGGVSINIPWKIYQGRQSSCPLLAKLKVLPGSLTDLSA
jgi:hypothetical protein